jgi:hypothetical protein
MQRCKRVLADNVLISLPIVVHLASTRARRWFGKGHTPEAFSCVLVLSRAFSCFLVLSRAFSCFLVRSRNVRLTAPES